MQAGRSWLGIATWVGVALLGAVALATIATTRGEPLSSAWFLVAALCVYAVGYRFYSSFLAARAFALDANRATPALPAAACRSWSSVASGKPARIDSSR